jgi:CRISPR-associated protein Csh1
MLKEMRTAGLGVLQERLRTEIPVREGESSDAWYIRLRNDHFELLLPWLVEASSNMHTLYTLEPDLEVSGRLRLLSSEVDSARRRLLPFVAQTGNSPQVGPLFKPNKSKTKVSPTPGIIGRTLKVFGEQAASAHPWSVYFESVLQVLDFPEVVFEGQVFRLAEEPEETMVELAVRLLGSEARAGVFLAISDKAGRLPGEVPEYRQYLAATVLEEKYVVKEAPAVEGCCSLCDAQEAVYPNGLPGAGLNFQSIDRAGLFSGLDTAQAGKRFALCLGCADLLYLYKAHCHTDWLCELAGEKALVIPCFPGGESSAALTRRVQRWVEKSKEGVAGTERHLLRLLSREEEVLSLHLLWAKFGQKIEEVEELLLDILPSRLRALSEVNEKTKRWEHPLFPAQKAREELWLEPELSMKMLRVLFKRRGKGTSGDDRRQSFKVMRALLAALYQGQSGVPQRSSGLERLFWKEVMSVAQTYLVELLKGEVSREDRFKVWAMQAPVPETASTKKKRKQQMTFGLWLQLLAMTLHYLRITGVFSMKDEVTYEPQVEFLKPLFGSESGVNSDEKAFAFLVGLLFGKLMEVQAAKGVNVSTNALSWLKRFRLRGSDLPGLLNKIRSRFLVYGTEASPKVRAVVEEVGRLGLKLGTDIPLDVTETCYFLLLGQSMSGSLLRSDRAGEAKEKSA